MRFENWDVLVFRDKDCIAPLQEFKTACQVAPDPEPRTKGPDSPNAHGPHHLLPVVTSFIPGLEAGTFFRISIHAWDTPAASPYFEQLNQKSEAIMFEARLFVDGRLTGVCTFADNAAFPLVINTGIDLDKYGNNEKLQFPAFHKEILSQSYWSAADDMGRIKIVISEGFQGSEPPITFARVKNIVSFSFQHAPLDVLEAAGLAWPNAAMWRHPLAFSPYIKYHTSPQKKKVDEGFSGNFFHSRKQSKEGLAPVYQNSEASAPDSFRLGMKPLNTGDTNLGSYTAQSEHTVGAKQAGPSKSSRTPERIHLEANRKPFNRLSGNKRQRTATAASKAIDAEDEPRSVNNTSNVLQAMAHLSFTGLKITDNEGD
ncbi:hypothetical protein B0O99DRAFT_587853 [Bisporella sp. PMI_857]|nr:hypothetical protein B0O99DRAFT_587853 [Bisporella sp. PMI_857]